MVQDLMPTISAQFVAAASPMEYVWLYQDEKHIYKWFAKRIVKT